MKSGIIYKMDMPFREPMKVRGTEFGNERGARSCAIVGSTRGNEVQQAFICARLLTLIANLERTGMLTADKSILVVPCINPFSMNIQQRFWPGNRTDINRSFPGDAQGRTTERIAAALLHVARTYTYGIQLCSFNQSGDFLPHVRVTHQSEMSNNSLELARDFGLPFVVSREPSPFDKSTLNYAWQECGTQAFSVYSKATDRIDLQSAQVVIDAVLRFLQARGILSLPKGTDVQAYTSSVLRESDLVDLRTTRSAGFLALTVRAGDRVRRGQKRAQVLDSFDTHVLETLQSPVDGRVFFIRTNPLVQQHMVVVRIAPE